MSKLILIVSLFLLAACGESKQVYIYTLYRNSIIPDLRIHVATFDAVDNNESYNRENCNTAKALFQSQPDVEIKYWCEKGEFIE